MKRKVLIGLSVILIAIIFIGFGFTKNVEVQKEYQRAMDRGIHETKKFNYQAARIDFQNAAKRKQDDPQAERNIKQLDIYLQAKKQLDKENYSQARDLFNQAADFDDGISVLVRRASAYATEIEEAQDQRASFEKIYDEAVECNEDGNYAKSNTLLGSILKNHEIKDRYYDSVRTKAKKLKRQNDKALGIPPRRQLKSEQAQ